jgi:GT2 family glycosyltransferase
VMAPFNASSNDWARGWRPVVGSEGTAKTILVVRVIMACHNRRLLTERAITTASLAAIQAGVRISFTIYEDGSNDGTLAALEKMRHDISIIEGDGSAYWARGMAESEAHVLGSISAGTPSSSEVILWLNDDVSLDSDSFRRLLFEAEKAPKSIIVGSMRDPVSGALTYGGLMKRRLHPLRFGMRKPGNESQAVDTFNGNLVLVPIEVALTLGGIEGRFSHAFADVDYGLRAQKQHVPVLLAPGSFGTCATNTPSTHDGALDAWADFTSAKGGGNFGSLLVFYRAHRPGLLPLYIAGTYVLWWLRNSLRFMRKKIFRRGSK